LLCKGNAPLDRRRLLSFPANGWVVLTPGGVALRHCRAVVPPVPAGPIAYCPCWLGCDWPLPDVVLRDGGASAFCAAVRVGSPVAFRQMDASHQSKESQLNMSSGQIAVSVLSRFHTRAGCFAAAIFV
jgi:hypothetical protein